MSYHSMKAEHIKFSKAIVIKVLGHTGCRDTRWYRFLPEYFNTSKHMAHEKLYDTIRNHLIKLQKDVKTAKEVALAAKQKKITDAKMDETRKEENLVIPHTLETSKKRGRQSSTS